MDKKIRIAGAAFGLFAVIIGAFGAHALEKVLNAASLQTFETGVKYQMYHSLLLLLIPSFELTIKIKKTLTLLLVAGILLFSGSIYGLATNELSTIDFTKIAFFTPLGGSMLIISWALLLYQFVKLR